MIKNIKNRKISNKALEKLVVETQADTWKMIKEDIKRSWSSTSEDELEGTSGDRREIVSILQKNNGKGLDDYHRKIDYIFSMHEGDENMSF
jgi:hypothetical protein